MGMKKPKYIKHITLQSGHSRDSYAGEVRPDIIALCQVMIGECLATDGVRVNFPADLKLDGYTLMCGRFGGGELTGSVWFGKTEPVPLVNFAIASKSRSGKHLWNALHEQATLPPATDPQPCPPEPWIAVSIEPDIEYYADALEWLGDFERCLAWAWIEYEKP
jgi:hypothetical protein